MPRTKLDHDKYLKTRVPLDLYQRLRVRAGASGLHLNTFVREALLRDGEAMSAAEALARVEAAIAAAAAPVPVAPPIAADHELRCELREVRLLLRELALQSNAQILARVAAQMAAHTDQPGQ
jgi:hypothetical protein